jgi:hypothetical protein
MTAGGNLAWAAANIGAPGIQFVLLNLSFQHNEQGGFFNYVSI